MHKVIKSAFIVLVISMTCAASVAAEQLIEGWKIAYNLGDYAEAFRLLRPQAEQGDADAQNNLGVFYEKGEGVPQDYAEAAKWYRKAAEQGVAIAQTNLGAMYSSGQGVPQDYAEAVKWFRKSANQGYAEAQFKLGLSYFLGEGVPQDYVFAHMWLNLGAVMGNENAIKYRDAIAAERMTPAQIAEAQRLAREWKPK